MRISGVLEKGKTSDIDFQKLESFSREKGAYTFLKSTTKLIVKEQDVGSAISDSANIEEQILESFTSTNKSKFNPLIEHLFRALQIEKHDDEKSAIFEDRLTTEVKKILANDQTDSK